MPDRLDHALAERGLARSRTAAARLIADGRVAVNGRTVTKASRAVTDADDLVVSEGLAFVSRSAEKLVAALAAFGIDPSGAAALDVGASTGGFTQVLLERGAREVVALDVGHDQLSPLLRSDTRVTTIEGENARHLTQERLDACIRSARDGRTPLRAAELELVVGDLSFISLRHILPALRAAVPNLGDAVLLVKPQFEVGRQHVRGGLVVDREVAADAAVDVVRDAAELGLDLGGFLASPVVGTHGNQEYLAWFRPAADDAERASISSDRGQWEDRIRACVTGRTS